MSLTMWTFINLICQGPPQDRLRPRGILLATPVRVVMAGLVSLDRHMFCTKCRGSECDQNTRCDECLLWTKEAMNSYNKLRKSLSSKSKNKKSSLKTSSSPPQSTACDSDIDAKLSAQLITVNKNIDDKISAMSNSLMSQFSEMLASFRSSLPNSSFSVDPAAPGQLVSHTESTSLSAPSTNASGFRVT